MDANSAASVELLPNPDYRQLDVEMTDMSVNAAVDNDVSLTDFIDVVNDANEVLEGTDQNSIEAYLLTGEDLENLAQGNISIDDLQGDKYDPSTVLSATEDEGNEDKGNVVFYRKPDDNFQENRSLIGSENNVVKVFILDEESRREDARSFDPSQGGFW